MSVASCRSAPAAFFFIVSISISVIPQTVRCSSLAEAGIAGFDQQVIASIVPGQPYDAFFGECPSIAHSGGTTYFVYTRGSYDIYARAFDHGMQSLSAEVLIGDGWNDHIRPAIQIGGGYLHVLYAARPLPLRYHRSLNPFDHENWSAYEQVGSSATYPVPFVLGDSLFVIYREGNSYSASLSMAMRDLDLPVGMPGAWSVTRLVEESSVFVPMPLAAFERDGSVCFLFNMRDALLSSPHMAVAPSVREGMSVVCTADGSSFTDLDGEALSLPLDYTQERGDFPEVTRHDEYIDVPLDHAGTFATGDLRHDGSFVELDITPLSYSRTMILIGDSMKCSCLVEFSAGGTIILSDNESNVTIGTYTPGMSYVLKLKFSFSMDSYRPWLNGRLAGDPLQLDCSGVLPGEESSIGSITVTEMGDCSAGLATGREFKLITSSAAVDADGEPNFFFIDRMDSSERSRWRLMHQRGHEVAEIGDTLYHKYQPSSLRIGDLMCVAVAYFEGEGLFLDNEHLCDNSRIMMLGSNDHENWDEMELAAGSGGHVHPIFKRHDGTGLTELIWARMESGTSTSLMHSFSGSTTGVLYREWNGPAAVSYPNPSSSSSTIRLSLDVDRTVSIEIYDCAGRLVRKLLDRRHMTGGRHNISWQGVDDRGRRVMPGIYFVRIRSGSFENTKKIVLIR